MGRVHAPWILVLLFLWRTAAADEVEPLTEACVKDVNKVRWRTSFVDFVVKCADVRDKTYAGTPCEGNDIAIAVKTFCTDPLGSPCLVDPAAVSWVVDLDCMDSRRATAITKSSKAEEDAGVGSLQDTVIRGLAAFLVSRAKAEALAAVVRNFRGEVCGGDDPDAKASDDAKIGRRLLPMTCALARATKADTPLAWGTFKAAFEADLLGLPERFTVVIADRIEGPVSPLIRVAGVILSRLMAGLDPLGAVTDALSAQVLPTCGSLTADPKREERAVEMALGMTGRGLQFVAIQDPALRDLDDLAAPIALRALYEMLPADCRATHAAIRSRETLAKVEELAKRVAELKAAFVTVAENARTDLRVTLTTHDERRKRAEDLVTAALALVSRVTDVVAQAIDVGVALGLLPTNDLELVRAKDLLVRVHVVADRITQAMAYARERQYARTFLELLVAAQECGVLEKLPKWFQRYLPFVTEVAAAETSEDVERALEAAAAPVGSYRAKRVEGRSTVSLNAFVGVQGGVEYVRGVAWSADSIQGGVFAPVGVEMAYGVCEGLSLGVFLSLLDLGTLVNFRGEVSDAGNTNVESEPAYTFAQVFAPGGYLTLGMSESWPLTFGLGASLVPQLRRVSDATSSRDAAAFRIGAFLAVDLPIFMF